MYSLVSNSESYTESYPEPYASQNFGSEHNMNNQMNNYCGIDMKDMSTKLMMINNDVKANHNNANDMYNLLLSDDFFNQVNSLASQIKNIKLNTIQCLSNNNKEKICNRLNKYDNQLNIDKLEKMLMVINKYNTMMNDMAIWIYTNLRDLYQYCEHDFSKIQKIEQIITRLSYIMADQTEMGNILNNNEIMPSPVDLYNQNTSSSSQEESSSNQEESLTKHSASEEEQLSVIPFGLSESSKSEASASSISSVVSKSKGIDWRYSLLILFVLIIIVVIILLYKRCNK